MSEQPKQMECGHCGKAIEQDGTGAWFDVQTWRPHACFAAPLVSPQAGTAPPDVIAEVAEYLAKAEAKHAPMRGAHEGYAVILEELDELWDEIKRQRIDHPAMRKEAFHVAAMALRFVKDVCGR